MAGEAQEVSPRQETVETLTNASNSFITARLLHDNLVGTNLSAHAATITHRAVDHVLAILLHYGRATEELHTYPALTRKRTLSLPYSFFPGEP